MNRIGGEYYFVVHAYAGSPGFARIAYLPAYYKDCGPPIGDVANFIPGTDFCSLPYDYELLTTGQGDYPCAYHPGDAEWVFVDVQYVPGTSHWYASQVFLSAHCGNTTGDKCGWYPSENLATRDGTPNGAPVVWVSIGKHANYASYADCHQKILGVTTKEDCGTYRYTYPIDFEQQNIGERPSGGANPHYALRDCDFALSASTMIDHTRQECIWTEFSLNPVPHKFWGWLPLAMVNQYPDIYRLASDSYGNILWYYGGI